MTYTIGFNIVGYLPEMEPYTADTADEAKRAMIDELKRDEESALDGEGEPLANELCHAAEDLNLEDVSLGWSAIIGNVSYWIVQTEVE